VLPLSGASSFLAWLSFFVWRIFMYLLYVDDLEEGMQGEIQGVGNSMYNCL